jgi:hypothetical protein
VRRTRGESALTVRQARRESALTMRQARGESALTMRQARRESWPMSDISPYSLREGPMIAKRFFLM